VDVFAFGLILYEMLVGQSVFPKDKALARICELHHQRYRPNIPNSVSRLVANVIQRCWAHDPNDRPDFEEIFSTLEGSWFPFFKDVSGEVIEKFMSMMNG
jgi:serine/threonine protein kinase